MKIVIVQHDAGCQHDTVLVHGDTVQVCAETECAHEWTTWTHWPSGNEPHPLGAWAWRQCRYCQDVAVRDFSRQPAGDGDA